MQESELLPALLRRLLKTSVSGRNYTTDRKPRKAWKCAASFIFDETHAFQGLKIARSNTVGRDRQMYTIASIDRIRELKQEIADLAKLNAQHKADRRPSDFTHRAHVRRSLRLLEIREELGALKRAQ